MDEQVMQGQEQPAGGSPDVQPQNSPSQNDPAAGGPDTTGLPPDQANAFARKWTAERQKLEQGMRAQMEAEFQQRLTNLAPSPQQPMMQQQSGALDFGDNPDELAEINSQLLEEFYENPLAAMGKAQQILADRQIARTQQMQQQWNNTAATLARKYSDFGAVLPQMQELVRMQPDLAEHPGHLERVYTLAKQMGPQQPDALLADGNFMNQAMEHLLQDPSQLGTIKERLRDQIIEEYVTGKRQSAAAMPPLMGGATGGSGPAGPPSQPRNWEDAKRAAMARIGQ